MEAYINLDFCDILPQNKIPEMECINMKKICDKESEKICSLDNYRYPTEKAWILFPFVILYCMSHESCCVLCSFISETFSSGLGCHCSFL